ncbi:MAG: hypothetical protein WBD27_08930 [Pyrinomonadaceae bacterium]
MMFFQDGEFPKLAHYLRSRIIGMNKNSKVFKALVECIGSEKIAKQAIDPGTYPRLIIEPLIRGMVSPSGIYQGECDPAKKNYVYIHTRIGEGFETDESARQYPTVFETTLLHEVVHWGRFIGGKPGEINGKEAGNWFNHRAYGHIYVYHSDLICR